MERDEKGKFVPGISGNPNGRPKFSPLSILREELQKVANEEKETFARLFIKRYLDKAIGEVDGVAMRDIIDRFDGKPKQHVIVNNEKDVEAVDVYNRIAGALEWLASQQETT